MGEVHELVRYELTGLDCPSCASKVERALKGTQGLEYATVDFASSSLHIPPHQEDLARTVISEVEPRAQVQENSEKSSPSSSPFQSLSVFRLLLSGGFFGLALIWNLFSSLPPWLYTGLLTASYIIAGYPVILGALRKLLRGQFIDELFLMTLASFGAIVIGELPEAAAVMLFYSIGEELQDAAVNKSRQAIQNALSLRVSMARLVQGSGESSVLKPEDVPLGSLVEVRGGESIPLDGVVEQGESWVDTSSLTGESKPRSVQVGDAVSAGYVNGEGRLRIRTTATYENSAVARLSKLLQTASLRKAPTERILSRFAAYYTPVVVGLALLLATLPPFLWEISFQDSLYRAMILLVISCPCALVVSVPLAYFAGIGRASLDKTLLKGADVLDAASRIQTIVFDKTGTLTEGKFTVQQIHPLDGITPDLLMKTAAQALSESSHPIAQAVTKTWQVQHPSHVLLSAETHQEIRGQGVMCVVQGHTLLAGNALLLHTNGISTHDPKQDGTVVHVAKNHCYLGYLLLDDGLKEGSFSALKSLKTMGISQTVMLTGDRKERAQSTGARLGIHEVQGELLPEGKMDALETYMAQSSKNATVAFVGDGMNDAPVILRSDVGMAMGKSGTDLAIEAADVIYMDDDPQRIPQLVATARKTRHIVKGNIIFALSIKLILMIMGAFGTLPLWVAIIGDVGVALLAVMNSLRILLFPKEI